jgi:hypothetical protein
VRLLSSRNKFYEAVVEAEKYPFGLSEDSAITSTLKLAAGQSHSGSQLLRGLVKGAGEALELAPRPIIATKRSMVSADKELCRRCRTRFR